MRISTLLLKYLAMTVFAAGVGWPAPRAEFVAQTGHTNAVDAVAFSRDGSLLASGGHDAIIKLWDVRSGSELRALAGHTNTITALVFSKDGTTVVSGALDSTVRFWDVASGNVIRTINRSVGVTSLALSFDGKTLAISGFDPEVRLVDFTTGNQVQVLEGHTRVVNSTSFSSNGRLLATGGNDNSVRVWDVPSGREVQMMAFPSSSAPTGAVRDARTGQEIEKPQNFNTDCVTSVEFSPDDSTLASVSYNLKNYGVNGVSFTIGLWDIASGKRVREVDSFMGGGPANFIFLPEHNSVAGSVSFSPDGQSLLATGYDYSIKQWDVHTGNLIKVLPVIKMDGDAQKAHETLAKFQAIRWDPPRLPMFSPNGKTAAIVLENSVMIWDVPAAKLVNYFGAHAATVSSVSFSGDGTTLASASAIHPTRLWNLVAGGSPQSLDRGVFPPGAEMVAFSPKQDLVATSAMDIYGSTAYVDLWDVKTGRKLRTLSGRSAGGVGIAFDSRGSKLAVGRLDDAVTLFNVATGTKIRTFDKTAFNSNQVVLSADGRALALIAWGNRTLQVPRSQTSPLDNPNVRGLLNTEIGPHITVWNTETGAVLFTQKEDGGAYQAIALSSNGKLLAGGGSRTVVWDVKSHRVLRRLDTLTSALTFSPDGTMLAGAEGTGIHIWNVVTGSEMALLSGHLGGVTSLAFSINGRRLASGSQDGSAKIWDLSTKSEVVTLFPLDDRDYLIATPENYYMTSRSGLAGVAFRVGDRVFPFEQFDLKYNRPDLVLKALGSAPQGLVDGYRAMVEERVQRMGFSAEKLGDDFHLPELRIVDPGPALSTDQSAVRFAVKAIDSRFELDRLNVYVDGVSMYGTKGLSLRDKHTKSVDQEVTVPLSSGRNKIQVTVVNEQAAESLAETADVTYTGPAVDAKLYLLSIGVTKYRDSQINLRYPASDARAQEEFWNAGTGRFKTVYTQVLADGQVTKEKIRGARSFLERAGVDDVVVVFLAGHGVLDRDGKYYFGTWDIKMGIPSEQGLPYSDIENLLDGISARRKLVLIDTCFAGADYQDELLRERFADLRRGTGAQVIAASGGLQQAEESNEFGSGTFTRALLEGLRGKADLNGDGEITVSELRAYVAQQVPLLSLGRQRPSVRAENLDLDFTLTKSY